MRGTACSRKVIRASFPRTSTAQLEVLERDLIPGAELGMVLENGEPAVGILVNRVGDQQVTAGAAVRAADAATQLVELGQAKAVSAIDEHGVGIRHVEPGFDDHRRD